MVRSSLDDALAISDPVARNYAITRLYHQMSEQVADVVGHADASWLTFGAWASATAGRFIRGEGAPVRWGAAAVAQGNAAIIADVGPRFGRFLELAEDREPDRLRDAAAAEPLLSESDELAEAFGCYSSLAASRASGAGSDDAHRAELMLRANLLVAHHEQRFADAFIDEAIPLGGVAGILATRFVSIGIPDGDLDVCRSVPDPPTSRGGSGRPSCRPSTMPECASFCCRTGSRWTTPASRRPRPGRSSTSGWGSSRASSAPTSATPPCSPCRRTCRETLPARRSRPALLRQLAG